MITNGAVQQLRVLDAAGSADPCVAKEGRHCRYPYSGYFEIFSLEIVAVLMFRVE